MSMPIKGVQSSEEGQSLVLILVVIVIGAVIAFAIAARTIQDIRRTGQERISDQAGTQVETYLDGVTSPSVLSTLVDDDLSFTGACPSLDGVVCTLGSLELTSLFGELVCDEASVKLRRASGIESALVGQDEVLQIDLEGLTGPGTFQIKWSGSKHLLIMIYALDPETNQVYLWEEPGVSPVALTDALCDEPWGSLVTIDQFVEINYPANPLFARVRPVAGSAEISATGVSDQQLAIKASCTLNGIYREFVRIMPSRDALPAAFDYVLYDRTTMINEF